MLSTKQNVSEVNHKGFAYSSRQPLYTLFLVRRNRALYPRRAERSVLFCPVLLKVEHSSLSSGLRVGIRSAPLRSSLTVQYYSFSIVLGHVLVTMFMVLVQQPHRTQKSYGIFQFRGQFCMLYDARTYIHVPTGLPVRNSSCVCVCSCSVRFLGCFVRVVGFCSIQSLLH